METGTTEAGCTHKEHGLECRKLTDAGETLCPHHKLLMDYREQEKEKRRDQRAKAKKPVRSVKGRSEQQQSYYNN